MNQLYVGFTTAVEVPGHRLPGYSVRCDRFLISDEAPEIPRARIFEPLKNSFNPEYLCESEGDRLTWQPGH
jgi:hypothetical protein